MINLAGVYTSADADMGAELKCQDHPDWYADIDGTNLPDVIAKATEHIRDDHREHVNGCLCSGTQVIDQRCIPTVAATR